MGCRAAVEACRLLGIELSRAEDEELVCVTENDACGIDAIQVLLSCTLGKGNMIMRMRGKQAWSFFDRKTGKSVRIVMKPFDRDEYTKEALMDRILNAPFDDIMWAKKPGFEIPERAKIFESRICECCGESVREDLLRFQDGKTVCLDCFKGYGDRW